MNLVRRFSYSTTLAIHRSLLTVPVFPLDSLLLVGIWNVVEFCTAIICACLPMVPTLLKDVFGRDTIKASNATPQIKSGYRQPRVGSSSSRTGLSGDTAVLSSESGEDMSLKDTKPIHVQENVVWA